MSRDLGDLSTRGRPYQAGQVCPHLLLLLWGRRPLRHGLRSCRSQGASQRDVEQRRSISVRRSHELRRSHRVPKPHAGSPGNLSPRHSGSEYQATIAYHIRGQRR